MSWVDDDHHHSDPGKLTLGILDEKVDLVPHPTNGNQSMAVVVRRRQREQREIVLQHLHTLRHRHAGWRSAKERRAQERRFAPAGTVHRVVAQRAVNAGRQHLQRQVGP